MRMEGAHRYGCSVLRNQASVKGVAGGLMHAWKDSDGIDLLASRGAGQINSFSFICCQS
jgi:hypothetical protein